MFYYEVMLCLYNSSVYNKSKISMTVFDSILKNITNKRDAISSTGYHLWPPGGRIPMHI